MDLPVLGGGVGWPPTPTQPTTITYTTNPYGMYQMPQIMAHVPTNMTQHVNQQAAYMHMQQMQHQAQMQMQHQHMQQQQQHQHQQQHLPFSPQSNSLSYLASGSLGATLASQLTSSNGGKIPYADRIVSEVLKFGDSMWYTQFIDYTKLRQNIKRIVFLEQNPNESMTFGEQSLSQNAPPGFTGTGATTTTNPNVVSNTNLSDPSSSSPSSGVPSSSSMVDELATKYPSTPASQKLRDIFWFLLSQELAKVESFYLRTESELAQQISQDLALDTRFFERSDSKDKLRAEHASYTAVVLQQWAIQKAAASTNPNGGVPVDSYMQLSQAPIPGSNEYHQFCSTLFPSQSISPQVSLMFLQTLKEIHPSLWSSIAQNAKALLPDLLSLVPYLPDPVTVDLLRHFLRSLLQIERLNKYGILNATIVVKLLKLYDFHTHRSIEKAYLTKLFTQPLFTSRILTNVFAQSQHLILTKLLPIKSSFTRAHAIINDVTCPACGMLPHMPVVLRCKHRVCFTCIAQRSSGLTCPIVGCSYHLPLKSNGTASSHLGGSDASSSTLDPGELQVEPALSKLLTIVQLAQETSPEFQARLVPATSPHMTPHLNTPQHQPTQAQLSPIPPHQQHHPHHIHSQGPSPMHAALHAHSPAAGAIGSVAHSHLSPSFAAMGTTGLSPMTGAMGLIMTPQGLSPMQGAIGSGGMFTQSNQPGGFIMSPQQQHQQQVHQAQQHAQAHAQAHHHAQQQPSVSSQHHSPTIAHVGQVKTPQQATMAYPSMMLMPSPSSTPVRRPAGRAVEGGKQSCHNCKTMRDLKLLMVCTADPDGAERRRKCRKKMCQQCMIRLFGLHLDRMTQSERDTWICPTCLNCCVCAACKKRDQDLGQPPVQLNPKTGVPLVSPYSNSQAYSPDGKFPPETTAPDALAMLASSTPAIADPFSQFRDRDDGDTSAERSGATAGASGGGGGGGGGTSGAVQSSVVAKSENAMSTGDEVSAPVAALVSMGGVTPHSSHPKVVGEVGYHRDCHRAGVAPASPERITQQHANALVLAIAPNNNNNNNNPNPNPQSTSSSTPSSSSTPTTATAIPAHTFHHHPTPPVTARVVTAANGPTAAVAVRATTAGTYTTRTNTNTNNGNTSATNNNTITSSSSANPTNPPASASTISPQSSVSPASSTPPSPPLNANANAKPGVSGGGGGGGGGGNTSEKRKLNQLDVNLSAAEKSSEPSPRRVTRDRPYPPDEFKQAIDIKPEPLPDLVSPLFGKLSSPPASHHHPLLSAPMSIASRPSAIHPLLGSSPATGPVAIGGVGGYHPMAINTTPNGFTTNGTNNTSNCNAAHIPTSQTGSKPNNGNNGANQQQPQQQQATQQQQHHQPPPDSFAPDTSALMFQIQLLQTQISLLQQHANRVTGELHPTCDGSVPPPNGSAAVPDDNRTAQTAPGGAGGPDAREYSASQIAENNHQLSIISDQFEHMQRQLALAVQAAKKNPHLSDLEYRDRAPDPDDEPSAPVGTLTRQAHSNYNAPRPPSSPPQGPTTDSTQSLPPLPPRSPTLGALAHVHGDGPNTSTSSINRLNSLDSQGHTANLLVDSYYRIPSNVRMETLSRPNSHLLPDLNDAPSLGVDHMRCSVSMSRPLSDEFRDMSVSRPTSEERIANHGGFSRPMSHSHYVDANGLPTIDYLLRLNSQPHPTQTAALDAWRAQVQEAEADQRAGGGGGGSGSVAIETEEETQFRYTNRTSIEQASTSALNHFLAEREAQ